jgi:hypothetical protein
MFYIIKIICIFYYIYKKIEKFNYFRYLNRVAVFIMVSIPVPPPRPEPQPNHPSILAIIICLSAILGIHQHEMDDLLEVVQAGEDPLPHDMLDLIRQPNLTEEQTRSLFRRMVSYVFRDPVGHLLNELLRLQRTVETWQYWRNPERYQPDSLIFMVVTLAILATHIDINASHIINIFQPFVIHHINADPTLAPLLEMLRSPVVIGNFRLEWRERIIEAFIQLSRNLSQNQARG